MRLSILFYSALIIFFTGCKQLPMEFQETAALQVDADEFMVDAISQSIEDTAEESMAQDSQQKMTVGVCIVNSDSSSRLLTFDDHLFPNTNVVLNGSISKAFNNLTCFMSQVGDLLQREHELKWARFYQSAYLNTSSSKHDNYLYQEVGGGEMLLRTDTGWQIAILGQNQKLFDTQGRKRMDISIYTIDPIVIRGTLSRVGRQVESGSVRIDHNLAKYSAFHQLQNLVWNDTCRCPVSGEITSDFSGNRTGHVTMLFQGCGKAQLKASNGTERELNLKRCEL